MIEKLLKAGADPNQLGPEGETPLMLVARTGNLDAIRVLLDHHADVNAKDKLRGTTALMWATEQSHPEAVKLLIEHGATRERADRHRYPQRAQQSGEYREAAPAFELRRFGQTRAWNRWHPAAPAGQPAQCRAQRQRRRAPAAAVAKDVSGERSQWRG